jgi:hemoglobin
VSETNLFADVGGLPFFERLVEVFYEGVVTDSVLWPLYPDQSDLPGARRRLSLFLAHYWGGLPTYLEERGHPRLRLRHMGFTVGPLERDRWLVHMAQAIDVAGREFDITDEHRAEMTEYFVRAAEHLRNDTGLPISGPKD